jgi:uncharacterized protein YukE
VSVTDIDAERVFRCAYRIEQVAEDVRTAAARTARCFPDDWRGDAGIAYQQRLDQTADRVRQMSVAYDAAGAALAPYARAVLEAQDMWRRSESLLAEAAAAEQQAAAAAAAQGVSRPAGPGLAEGFRAAAYRLQAEAADVEHRAAVVCAATLDDEAGRAPATSGWRSADRFLGDVARFGVDTVAGTASLIGMSWHALPGIGSHNSRHEARNDLVEAGNAAVASIWNLPVDVRDAVEDDRPGLAAAAVAGVWGPGKLSKFDRQLRRHAPLAEKEAYREADRRALTAGHTIYRQTAFGMGRDGVSLVNEELRGGHVLERHVGASRSYLRFRNALGTEAASTFRDLATAEQLVNSVLAEHAGRLADVYALALGKSLRLTSQFDFVTGRVTVRGFSKSMAAHAVTVVLKLKDGEPLVYTAFPAI